MSLYQPTYPKISGALGTTTTEFGGDWGNFISDLLNGVNIGLIDPTKRPKIGTQTFWKNETISLLDGDQSHSVIISVNDIDTGVDRKIIIKRMNSPYLTDYMVLEGLPQPLLNKSIDSDLNTMTNIVNANIKAAAGITYSKLNLTNSIVPGDITSDAITTVKILDANVTLNKLASNSVNSSKIVDDSIVNADINSAAAIVWTKISKSGSVLSDIADTTITTPAQYDILVRNGASKWINQVKGSNSTALTVDASGVLAYTTITNAMLAGSIAYSKLTLTNSVVNADVASGAAIAYSKLSLTGTILNTDISASATIAYSKLSLTGSILNADINASAGIVTSKLADSANFFLKNTDNNIGTHYVDITRMTAPGNPSTNNGRIYSKQVDSNNDGLFCKIKRAGSFVEVQIL